MGEERNKLTSKQFFLIIIAIVLLVQGFIQFCFFKKRDGCKRGSEEIIQG